MASVTAYPVRSPQWVMTYRTVDITADVSTMVTSIIYTDRLGGAAGEIEVQLEDHDKRWQGPWYPQQGDKLNLIIGYRGEPLLPCGDFQVDDLELSGPPDTFHIRGLAAWITPAMRTRNSTAYENQTLIQIASTIAAKYGLSLVGVVDALNVSYARVTQKHETDLEFVRRLALAHGYEFTVRGEQLVFYSHDPLEASPPVATITRSDLLSFAFRSKSHRVYRAAQVSYQNPATKELVTQQADAPVSLPQGDTLKLIARCENGQQALLKARGALHATNMAQMTAILETPGMNTVCAGNNLTISGFGANDGIYIVTVARHRLTRAGGYRTEAEVRRVGQ